jgi:hypothetical protein
LAIQTWNEGWQPRALAQHGRASFRPSLLGMEWNNAHRTTAKIVELRMRFPVLTAEGRASPVSPAGAWSARQLQIRDGVILGGRLKRECISMIKRKRIEVM